MFYPLFMDLRDRAVLVVGGGPIAERKISPLLDAGARVTVIAPDVTPKLRELATSLVIRVLYRKFEEADVTNVRLVISATDDIAVQEKVAAAARSKNVPVNTVDQPRLCDFIVPAIVHRGDIAIAISTSGQSPALAAALRRKLETVITEDTARAARLLGEVRVEIHSKFPDPERRKDVFESIVNSGILDWISQCDDEAARQRIRKTLQEFE